MHTEKEAKELWCPFARVVVQATNTDDCPVASANRLPGVGGTDDPDLEWPSPRCIGSACMAWEWIPLMADQPFMDAVKQRMDESKDKHPVAVKYVRANLAEFGLPDKPFRGDCGLKRKP